MHAPIPLHKVKSRAPLNTHFPQHHAQAPDVAGEPDLAVAQQHLGGHPASKEWQLMAGVDGACTDLLLRKLNLPRKLSLPRLLAAQPH